MARFSEQFIQQVQQATDIVDLISQYVALKKRGREFVGLCPFHDDNHPSMNVSPAKQIFKCFVCGAGGSAFNFVMLYDKLAFPDAVRALAERANIALPRESAPRPVEEGLSKNELLRATLFAARFYRSQLQSPGGAGALDYARKRGLTDESIARFGLGYAPDAWDALLTAAGREGFTREQLVAAGLVSRREGGEGCYDRFRNRLIFPILDVSGNVIAFGGRALAEEERAKYLNSPETALFDKSAQLYGLNWSRGEIVSSGRAVVVEGYLDALIPLQAGVGNVVATLGTALTERHARLLARYARDVVLVFDADAAGQAAAQRALETFLTQQFQVRVASVPAGKDPCDFVLAEGGEPFTKLVDAAPDALEYAWGRCRASQAAAGGNLADGRAAVEEFLRLVASSSAYGAIDAIRRGQLAQHIGHMLNIPPAELQQQMRRLGRRHARRSGPSQDGEYAPAVTAPLAERHVLEVLLNEPELFDQVAERIGPDDFESPALRVIAARLWRLGADGRAHMDDLVSCEEMSPYGALIADLATEGQRRGNYEATLDSAVDGLVYRRGRRELQALKSTGLTNDSLRAIHDLHREADPRRRPTIT